MERNIRVPYLVAMAALRAPATLQLAHRYYVQNKHRASLPFSRRTSAARYYSTLVTTDVGIERRMRNTSQTRAVAADVLTRPETIDKPVEVEFVSLEKGFYTVKGTLKSAAPASDVYALLTEYESNTDIFKGVSEAKLLQTEPEKHLLQVCQWRFLTFSGEFETVLSVDEVPCDMALTFKLVKSSFMSDFQGRWQVFPDPEGGCTVIHVLSVKPALKIPSLITFYTKSIFERQVQQLMSDLDVELKRRQQQE